MAETVTFEDATRRVIRATRDGIAPGEPGYWESTRTEWKPGSTGANEATLRSRVAAALAANATFMAAAKPGTAAAQASAAYDQTVRLTRECTALIRLLLGLLADVSDT
jgi:hypothetical protein